MRREIQIRINPDVLIWARESINKSIEETAKNIGVKPAQITNWESGLTQPTYNQLENLAYKAYKRPIAVLFRKSPPVDGKISRDFRSISESSLNNCSSQLYLAIKEAKYVQSNISNVIDDSYHNIISNFKVSANPEDSAKELRELIDFRLEHQKHWKAQDSLNRFKELIEKLGIFVLQFNFPISDARGFSIYGDFPIIVINQNDSPNGRIFTLFHELYHLILRSSNIFSDYFLDYDKNLELTCNTFAAEFLVPKNDFLALIGDNNNKNWDDNSLYSLASQYKVSKEVILRRLITMNYSTWEFYNLKRAEWILEFEESKIERSKKQKSDNKTVIISKAQKVIWERGRPLVRSTLRSIDNGSYTLDSALSFFNVKLENLNQIIHKVN